MTFDVLYYFYYVPFLPLGSSMSLWVVAHPVAVAVCCLSLCVAVSFAVLQLLTLRRLSHY